MKASIDCCLGTQVLLGENDVKKACLTLLPRHFHRLEVLGVAPLPPAFSFV